MATATATATATAAGPEAAVQERLRNHLSLLRSEQAILERVVYKGKNQHRRCPYFNSVLKVRRDLKLLLSSGIDDVLANLFCVIDASDPEKKIRVLEGLKRKHANAKHNFHERLLGVARLLSQMTEPILVAAVRISSLLARSFFMGYSLIILSLLARLRVLSQQMLLESVTVYNLVTGISQKKHSIKLIRKGTKAYREYHPPCREFLLLKCVWEKDKFVLHEEVSNSLISVTDDAVKEPSLSRTPVILYDTLEIPTEGEQPSVEVDDDTPIESTGDPLSFKDQLGAVAEAPIASQHLNEDAHTKDGQSLPDLVPNDAVSAKTNLSQDEGHLPCSQSASSSKVAFIPVRKYSPRETVERRPEKKARLQPHSLGKLFDADESEDPFFKLLTTGLEGKML